MGSLGNEGNTLELLCRLYFRGMVGAEALDKEKLMETAIKNEDRWQCQQCGYKGGEFKVHGNGVIQCPVCSSLHRVNNGEVDLCQ